MPAVDRLTSTSAPARRELYERAIRLYSKTFGAPPTCVAAAPGRINLIGEHTDYNNGFVLPAAIDRLLAVSAGERRDGILSVYSESRDSHYEMPLEHLHPPERASWHDYAGGVASLLRQRHPLMQGANLCVVSSIPEGAGLSSSAALEVATATAVATLNGITLDPLEMIQLCRRAENNYVGVACGIMDQFIATLGKTSHALFLDCRSLEFRHIPFPAHASLIVCDTAAERRLAASEYNKRREECQRAVDLLQRVFPGITSLRDVGPAQLDSAHGVLDALLQRRARHVVTENERVKAAVDALLRGDINELGSLMYKSHLSLKRDFQVSCTELDAVVDICAEVEGVYGARMTGAGFGGSAVCLARDDVASGVIERLELEYPKATGRRPSVYRCGVVDGASILML